VFLAFTGLLQTYGLHEDHGAYQAPQWVQRMAQVHKNQRLALRHAKPPHEVGPPVPEPAPRSAPKAPDHHSGAPEAKAATVLLKAFFALVAVSLISSTVTGVWMALRPQRTRMVHLLIVLAGAVLPALLAAVTL